MQERTENFKVVTISDNSNSFGLKQFICVAKSGKAYKACANSLNLPKQGALVVAKTVSGTNQHQFKGSFELVESMDDCPKEVVEEIWDGQ